MIRKMILSSLCAALVFSFMGCTSTVMLNYSVGESSSSADIGKGKQIKVEVKDNRADPEIIGYGENQYGMRAGTVKLSDPNISKDIKDKVQNRLLALGYKIDATTNDILTISMNSIEGIAKPKFTNVQAEATATFGVTYSTNNSVTYNKNFEGKGSGSAFSGWGKPVKGAVENALKDGIQKILFDSALHDAMVGKEQ